MSSSADRNLLIGVLALQMDFVSRDQLLAAMNAWVLEKQTPLDEILARQGALQPEHRTLLTALVAAHLKQHDDDPQKSLAAVGSLESVRDDLKLLADPEIERSLVDVTHDLQSPDEFGPRTTSFSIGESSSLGLRFRVLRPHAKGGLGEVFVAEDGELNREVALKQIQAKYADDPNRRSRFMLEAEITGGLEHPGIVPVYGLGTYADGRPFYAMRFVRGNSLKDAIARFHIGVIRPLGGGLSSLLPLSPADGQGDGASAPAPKRREPFDIGQRAIAFRKLLGRFIDVCDAIQYAHSRGVVHRDLKPTNIMLGKYGETLVVDWGLAKAIGRAEIGNLSDERTLRPTGGGDSSPTQMGSAIGTPQFMSPEQAEGRLDLLGPRSDVYSLGATLYCILTGQPPLADQSDTCDVLRLVARGEIAPPRAHRPEIPKPLDAICRKAMALKPADRYATARALADDIEHWLADEPVSALPDTLAARASRFARRHRAWVQAAAVALVLIAALSVAGTVLINGARSEAVVAKNQATKLAASEAALKDQAVQKNAALARSFLDLAISEFSHGNRSEAVAILAQAHAAAPPGDLTHAAAARLLGAWVDFAPIHLPHDGQVNSIAFSPDCSTVLTGSRDNTARLWDAHTGKPLGTPLKHEGSGAVTAVAFSPDGSTCLTASTDRTARLWDARTGRPLGEPLKHGEQVLAATYSPDGATILTGSGDHTARLWDARTGKPRGEPLQHENQIVTVAYSPDGSTFLTVTDDHTAWLWDARTGKPLGKPLQHKDRITSVAFSPDGSTVLTGSFDGTARLWDVRSGKAFSEPLKNGPVFAVAYSPDGSTVATGGWDHAARLWDVPSGKTLGEPLQHGGPVEALVFAPDGSTILTGSRDGTARLWDARSGKPLGESLKHGGWVKAVAYSPDGSIVLTISDDNAARLWDVRSGEPLGEPLKHDTDGNAVAYSPDGSTVLAGSVDGTARLWDAHSGKPLGEPFKHGLPVDAVAYSPDGSTVLTGSRDGTARLWDARSGKPLGEPLKHGGAVGAVAYSPNGSTVLTGSSDGTARLWDARSGRPLGGPLGKPLKDARRSGAVLAVAYSPDGSTVLTGSHDVTRLWDARSGEPLGKPLRHLGANAVAYGPDGSNFLTGSDDGTARLWDARTRKPLSEPLRHEAEVLVVAYSPDGSIVLSGSRDGTVRLWDARLGKPIGQPLTPGGQVRAVAFSPDGAAILTRSSDHTARFWAAPMTAPEELVAPLATIYSGMRADESGSSRPANAADAAAAHRQIETTNTDWLQERRNRDAWRTAGWHRYEAATAEDEKRWFAAAFHLRWLLKSQPKDEDLKERLVTAEQMLVVAGEKIGQGAKCDWSPDGTRIVATKRELPGTSDAGLQLLSLADGQVKDLTPRGKDPAWSSLVDGIAFVRIADDGKDEIWLVQPDGTHARKVATGGYPHWSGDGKTLYFHDNDAKWIMAVSPMNPDSTPREFCKLAESNWPVVSPDGSKVAYVGGPQGLVVAECPRGTVVRSWSLGEKAGGGLVAWHPDGKRLAYGNFAGSGNGLWLADLESGRACKIIAGNAWKPAWSKDGKKLLYVLDDNINVIDTAKLPNP